MDQPVASAASRSAAPVVLQAQYIDRARDLMPLYLKTLALTLVTLGIYRFWARTRLRQRIWSRTAIDGDGFEYAGTGAELFFGFLKALAILLPLAIAYFAVEMANSIEPSLWLGAAQLVLYVTFIYLFLVGGYAGLRYRMNRTRWRGIRFRQEGSPWRYGAMALGGYALAMLTLGIYLPYLHVRLARFEAEHRWFGSQRFGFDGDGRQLLPYLLRALAIGAGVSIGLLLLLGTLAYLGYALFAARGSHNPDFATVVIGLGAIVAVLVFYGGMSLVFAHYNARRYSYVIGHTRWGELAFHVPSPITTMAYVRLVLGNIITIVLSLTLLYPVVVRRTMRFWCARMAARGTVDFARISQAEGVSGTGEGIAGYFNVDAMGG